MIKYSRTFQKLVNNAECHAELVSASLPAADRE